MLDWLTISQVHGFALPIVSDGVVYKADSDGQLIWKTVSGYVHPGSFDSSLLVKCDGASVTVSGNPSRFNRRDNVHGLPSVSAGVAVYNRVLRDLGLPGFTTGQFVGEAATRVWTGAVLRRVDMCTNFSAGSLQDAQAFIAWLQTQKIGRGGLVKPQYGDSTAVLTTGRYVYDKAYLKGPEVLRNAGEDEYLGKLGAWLTRVGCVRMESSFKSRFLHQQNLRHFGAIDEKRFELEHAKRLAPIWERCERETFDGLPLAVIGTLHRWQKGENPFDFLSQATFYRHRKLLRACGADIAGPAPAVPLPVRPRLVQLSTLEVPEWYRHAA